MSTGLLRYANIVAAVAIYCCGAYVAADILVMGHWAPGLTLVALLVASAVIEVMRMRLERRREYDSHNCSACGKHRPTPCVIVTIEGRLGDHTGVCLVWCKDCAQTDELHLALVRHIGDGDGATVMAILAVLARRGVGRVTWMSKETLARVRQTTGGVVHEVAKPTERTVH